MLRDRVLSAVVLLPIVVVCLLLGGWAYTLLVTLVLELAAWEYQDLLRRNSYRPSRLMLGLGTAFWPLLFALQGEKWAAPGLFALAIAGAFWQMRHHDTLPSASWALTLAGSTYLGLGGAYLIKLRAMPDGLWWSLTALPVVWIADSAAYFIGRRWGVHKMAPALSPKKSWEGYAAGIVGGLASGALLPLLWEAIAGPTVTLSAGRGALLGLVLAAITPAGDFFESMFKREAGVKDSGHLIPGHGGAFDRIDSLLWVGWLSWVLLSLLG